MTSQPDTGIATDCLLNALANLAMLPDGTAGLRLGLKVASAHARSEGLPAVAHVWDRLADLAAATHRDLEEVING